MPIALRRSPTRGMLAEDKPRTLYLDKLTLASNDSVAFFNELHLMLGYLIDNKFVAAAQVCSPRL